MEKNVRDFGDPCLYSCAAFVRLEIRKKYVYMDFLCFHDYKKSLISVMKYEEE